MTLSGFGIFSMHFRTSDRREACDVASELEELGYRALWVPGSVGGDVLEVAEAFLGSTSSLVVATGVLNVWMHDPGEVAAVHARLNTAHGRRFLLGLGISHAPLVERKGRHYERPLETMMRYLDELDRGDPPVPADERVLGALGPKMLDLARARSAGAHPYLVTPDHTALARGALGDDRLLAPNQMIVLSSAPSAARAIARQYLAIYLGLPNYTNNLRRLGFGDEDLAPPGSDRLVDALVVWGKIDEIVSRSKAHIDAGADHVVLQVLTEDSRSFPRYEWRELADGLALVD